MLRGIAVLLVVFRHHRASGPLGEIGWLGVDLFFVLSGFLVSGLIFDEHRLTHRFDGLRFLIRRGFKIYPSFYAFILVTFILKWALGRQDPWINYLAEVLFFQNYHQGVWVHTWSLAVEEHFYFLLVLAATVIITWLRRPSWRTFVVGCVCVMLITLGLRIHAWLTHPVTIGPSHLRMDSLLAGVLLAGWHRYRPASFVRFFCGHAWSLSAAMVLLLLPATLWEFGSFPMFTVGLTGAYLSGMIAIGLAVANTGRGSVLPRPIRDWLMRPVAWVGGISYTVYLWHILVVLLIERYAHRLGILGDFTELILFVALSLALGFFTSRTVERFGLQLRERYFPARSPMAPRSPTQQ